MNTMKLILTVFLSFYLTACTPTKYDKNGKSCPPITYGIPECEDEDMGVAVFSMLKFF